MQIFFLAFLFVLGSCFGSFLCCEARRLHLQTTSKGEHKKNLGSRSVCLNCKYQLKWYDNIPIISWLALRGKCRKCHKKIGFAELLSELGLAIAFLALGTTVDLASMTPLSLAIFIITLVLVLSLGFLAIYDGLYGELPVFCLIIAIIIGFIILVLKEIAIISISGFSIKIILDPIFSVIILGGVYLALYLVSKGKWVGDGDWLLGVAIGLALASPWLALVTLCMANVLAFLIMAPTIKKNPVKHIYFGPFMVAAFILALTFANFFQYVIISL